MPRGKDGNGEARRTIAKAAFLRLELRDPPVTRTDRNAPLEPTVKTNLTVPLALPPGMPFVAPQARDDASRISCNCCTGLGAVAAGTFLANTLPDGPALAGCARSSFSFLFCPLFVQGFLLNWFDTFDRPNVPRDFFLNNGRRFSSRRSDG